MDRADTRLKVSSRVVIALFTLVVLAVLCLLVFSQDDLTGVYQNASALSNLQLLPIALLLSVLLLLGARRFQAPCQQRIVVWICAFYGAVYLMQIVVVRALWYYPGWDAEVTWRSALALARTGESVDTAYFSLCPNNAALAVVLSVPLWLATRLGMAVPYGVLPYCAALLLNLACLCACLCVRVVTRKRYPVRIACAFSAVLLLFSPYIAIPYSDTFSILFPALALLIWVSCKRPWLKWLLVGLVCSVGAAIKATVYIVLIALVITSVLRAFMSGAWKRPCALLLSFLMLTVGVLPGRAFSAICVETMAGSSRPEAQLGAAHYLMIGHNRQTMGGHSQTDLDFSRSFQTLDERDRANLRVALERFNAMSLWEKACFYSAKLYKTYADGTFAVDGSHLRMEVPRRDDAVSKALRAYFYGKGACYPVYATICQGVWLTLLLLCLATALSAFRRARIDPLLPALCLTLLGLTAYQLLFEAWPRYVLHYLPIFIIMGATDATYCSRAMIPSSAVRVR